MVEYMVADIMNCEQTNTTSAPNLCVVAVVAANLVRRLAVTGPSEALLHE